MSLSLFPQIDLQISDLASLSVDYRSTRDRCFDPGDLRLWMVVESADGRHTADAFASFVGNCVEQRWSGIDFLADK